MLCLILKKIKGKYKRMKIERKKEKKVKENKKYIYLKLVNYMLYVTSNSFNLF